MISNLLLKNIKGPETMEMFLDFSFHGNPFSRYDLSSLKLEFVL